MGKNGIYKKQTLPKSASPLDAWHHFHPSSSSHKFKRYPVLDLVVCFGAKDICMLDKCSMAEHLSECQVLK